MMINHWDLLKNNIHVDAQTGCLTGIVDWRDARMGPLALSSGDLRTSSASGREVECASTLTTLNFADCSGTRFISELGTCLRAHEPGSGLRG